MQYSHAVTTSYPQQGRLNLLKSLGAGIIKYVGRHISIVKLATQKIVGHVPAYMHGCRILLWLLLLLLLPVWHWNAYT